METLDILFQSISFILAMLAIIVLLFVNKEQLHSNRMLALVLLILALTNINVALLYNQWFLIYPRLHKILLPVTLLIAPAAYVYVRSVVLGELKFRKLDWLFLVPFVLCLIDLLPYYSLPLAEKKAYMVRFYQNKAIQSYFNEGILPAYFFPYFRVAWSSVFVVANFILLKRYKSRAAEKVLVNNKNLQQWLYLFSWLITAMLLGALLTAIVAPIKGLNQVITDFTMATSAIIICVQLFTKPKLLYGVYQPTSDVLVPKDAGEPTAVPEMYETISPNETPEPKLVISQSDSYRYKIAVENLFHLQKPFLQTDYSLDLLVESTSIPRYILSAFINKEYGMGFREFLNGYRVDYFKDNLNNPDWHNLTLEAIAEQCGFNSRSSFIKNFKQIAGQTPSDFVKQSKSQSLPAID